MFGLIGRERVVRRGFPGRTVLRLEGLEHREQPSGPGHMAPAGWTNTDSPTNQRPAIVDFRCEEIGNGLFVITGRVVDESPGGLTVTLGGNTSAAGQATATGADGTFSLTVRLRVDGTDSGFITATTVDAQGLVSEEVSQFVDPTPP